MSITTTTTPSTPTITPEVLERKRLDALARLAVTKAAAAATAAAATQPIITAASPPKFIARSSEQRVRGIAAAGFVSVANLEAEPIIDPACLAYLRASTTQRKFIPPRSLAIMTATDKAAAAEAVMKKVRAHPAYTRDDDLTTGRAIHVLEADVHVHDEDDHRIDNEADDDASTGLAPAPPQPPPPTITITAAASAPVVTSPTLTPSPPLLWTPKPRPAAASAPRTQPQPPPSPPSTPPARNATPSSAQSDDTPTPQSPPPSPFLITQPLTPPPASTAAAPASKKRSTNPSAVRSQEYRARTKLQKIALSHSPIPLSHSSFPPLPPSSTTPSNEWFVLALLQSLNDPRVINTIRQI